MHRFDNTLSELASISYTGENWDLFYMRVRYFLSYSFTGRKEVIRIFHALDMWLRGSVGSSTQLLSERRGFNPRSSLNFCKFLLLR